MKKKTYKMFRTPTATPDSRAYCWKSLSENCGDESSGLSEAGSKAVVRLKIECVEES